MGIKQEKDLPGNCRATWLKAVSAMQWRNYGYTIQLLRSVLKEHPEFLPGRQLVRKAAIARASTQKGFFSRISSPVFSIFKIRSLCKRDPYLVLDAVEKLLESVPYNIQANRLLHRAALACHMPETAAFALETILEGNPKDIRTMHELALHDIRQNEPQKAVEIYHRILEMAPRDLAAAQGARDAAAKASMQQGGWDREESTYRDLIQTQEFLLKQPSGVVHSDEEIIRQFDDGIREHEETIASYPDTPESETCLMELPRLRGQRAAIIVESAKYRVEQNPTDWTARFELGEALVGSGQFQEAIRELQISQRHPSIRLRAMSLLGRCYQARRMYDLAAKTYEDAAREIFTMDATKKEIIYHLGLVYEAMGDPIKSLDCMKKIYEVDAGYPDVADRVEKSYFHTAP